MDQFDYVITEPQGLCARPAGLLAREARKYESLCTISKGTQTKKLTRIMMLMNMGVKQGDTVTVKARGVDSAAAIAGLKAVFEDNL